MLELKAGVMLKDALGEKGIQPEMVLGALVVYSVFNEEGFTCTITSCMDGVHKQGSLHYKGQALDFRTRHVVDEEALLDIVQAIKFALGEEFDVVLEEDHLHVEYDPK